MKRPTLRRGLVALCGAICLGCADDPVRPPDRELSPPGLTILFPTGSAYDENADALVDLRISWSDSAGAVNPQSVQIRTLREGTGSALPTVNLVDH